MIYAFSIYIYIIAGCNMYICNIFDINIYVIYI